MFGRILCLCGLVFMFYVCVGVCVCLRASVRAQDVGQNKILAERTVLLTVYELVDMTLVNQISQLARDLVAVNVPFFCKQTRIKRNR